MHGGAGEKGRGQNDGDHPAQHSAHISKGLDVFSYLTPSYLATGYKEGSHLVLGPTPTDSREYTQRGPISDIHEIEVI